MSTITKPIETDSTLSLSRLLDPEVLANPYPLYHRLRTEDPVHWDPLLHTWVVTGYANAVEVLHNYSADRAPTPEQFSALGLGSLNPIVHWMLKMMLFIDGATHARLRSLAASAFSPSRVEVLRNHIQDIVDSLIDSLAPNGKMDVIADLGYPLPAIVTAELLGVPEADRDQLKAWSTDLAEMLGSFQHSPDRIPHVLKSMDEMTEYFRSVIRKQRS